MEIPQVGRPYMPGYGIAGPEEGSGLLHWSWAAERLTAARSYWVATVWPDGRPHVMPVWGMWDDSALWFTSSTGSRKVRNLAADPRCCVTTEDASDPVIIEGIAHFSTETQVLTETATRLTKQSLAMIADRADAARAVFKPAA